MSTELEHLHAFRADDAAPDPDASAAARAALLERIAAADAPTRARTRARSHPRQRLLAGGLGLAGAAAAAVALLAGVGPRGVQPPDAAAAQLLHRAAAVAAKGPDIALQPGQYWYTRSTETSVITDVGAHPFSVLQDVEREVWVGRDGGGRLRQRAVGAARFMSPRDRAGWIAAGRPDLGNGGGVTDLPLTNEDAPTAAGSFPFGSRDLTYEQLRALPTSTDALYARVAQEARENHNSAGDAHEMFTIVGDALREEPIPPALRAALYRVAARIPGVELIDRARDAAGRPGVAVALGEHGERSELIFDPRTAVLLGERGTLDGHPADVSAYLDSGIVESTHARP